MTTKFFTSDTHFGHAKIIELCKRPFKDVAHMNESLIERWNDTVKPEDVVYHLGDVALGPWVEWNGILSRLHGKKVLIIGNHDRIFSRYPEKHRIKFAPVYSQWFGLRSSRGMTQIGGKKVNLSHFPYDGDSHDGDRYVRDRLPDKGITLVHGHTHSKSVLSTSAAGTKQIHVGADAWDYTPVPADKIEALL